MVPVGRRRCLRLLVLLAGFALAAPNNGSHLLEVEDEDGFQHAVSSQPVSLVLFTAPNCAPCNQVRERVARATEALREDSSVAAIVIDGTREPDLVALYGIRGFPALVTFRYNAARDSTTFAHYSGSLASADDIHEYMVRQTGPTCAEVRTYAELRRMLAQNFTVGTAALGVFTEAPGTPSAKAYKLSREREICG